MELSPQTIERLRETVAFIGQEPRRLDMHQGLGPSAVGFRMHDDLPPCGTVGCLAGWRVAMIKPKDFEQRKVNPAYSPEFVGWEWSTIERIATVNFGLTDDQAYLLFHVRNWPPVFALRYRTADTAKQRWAALRDRVEHFITTGGEA